MRLIDADALKDKCYITVNGATIGRNNYVMFHEIDDAPTINAVEVVRCKDCKHRDEKCGMGERRWCKVIKMSTVPNDFCSYGKRKGGDTE